MTEDIELEKFKRIEQIESKYLGMLNSSLQDSTQLKKELESQNKFLTQFMNPIDRATLEFKKKNYIADGAERVIYNSINKSGFFGTPNSSPIGGDLFFEKKDNEFNQNLLISIDLKTVRAETNIGDIKNFDIGLNQHSYKSAVEYDDGTKRLINPMLQAEYSGSENRNYLLISYLIVILYDVYPSVDHPEKTNILMISNFCAPNGLLEPHYLNRPWVGGKSPLIKVAGGQILKKKDGSDYLTKDDEPYKDIIPKLGNIKKKEIEEEYKSRTGKYLIFYGLKGRLNYKEIKNFEIFDENKKIFKVVYLATKIPPNYQESLNFFKENFFG